MPFAKPQLLVHRTDSQVDDELNKALQSVVESPPAVIYRAELREVIEAARAYQPAIVMTELTGNFDNLRTIVSELAAVSPYSVTVGLFSVERSGTTNSEASLMLQALRLGVEDFIRRPISSNDLQQLLALRLKPRRVDATPIGVTTSFVSNKGGVGKSTAAVNLAVELARRHDQRVLLIDGSLQMGVCAAQLHLKPKTTLVDAWRQRERLDEQLLRQLTTVHATGLHLLAAPANAVESSDIDDAIVSRIILLARRCFDFVVIDTFPLFDRVSMAILDLSDFAYIVTENVVPTLQTVRGFLELLDQVGFPQDRQGLLLNRYTKSGNSPNVAAVEQYLNRTVDHVVPFDKRVMLSANTGHPFVLSLNWLSRSRRAICALADKVERRHPQFSPWGRDLMSSSNGNDSNVSGAQE